MKNTQNRMNEHSVLIADSGSTKTNWCLVDGELAPRHFNTEGYNPFFVDSAYITNSLRSNFPSDFAYHSIKEVHFYGAGCQDSKIDVVKNALRDTFPNATLAAEGDLLGAARGLLDESPGFAAILGTGMNTCLYDGKRITKNIESLGFLLGDEGSGTDIGRHILADYIRGKMPARVSELFYDVYRISPEETMSEVYGHKLPNRFCASFTKFLKHPEIELDYTNAIVSKCFNSFFTNLVCSYPDYQSYTFNCLGSVGYHFSDILRQTALSFGMKTGKIIPGLIDDLVLYHRKAEKLSSAY